MVTTRAIQYVNFRHDLGHWSTESTRTHRYRLVNFADTVTVDAERLTRRHAERWLSRPGLAPATRRALLGTLRGFSMWMVDRGYCPRDITAGITAPPIPRYAPRNLTGDEVAATLDACDTRGRVCVLLAVQEGLRRGEIAALEIGDVDLSGRTVAVKGKGGRGKVTRVLPLSDQTAFAIRRYMDEAGGRGGPLVRNERHPEVGVSPQTVTRIVDRAMKAAGVKHAAHDGRSAHALRHTMAEDLFKAGADVREVQHALGHATMQSTQVYLRARPDDLRPVMAGRSYG